MEIISIVSFVCFGYGLAFGVYAIAYATAVFIKFAE